MSVRVPMPFLTALDTNGDPVSGAKAYFYEAGTTTPLDTYSDSALSTPNANPVIADSAGRFGDIFVATDDYKLVLKDADDVTIKTIDDISITDPSNPTLTNIVYTATSPTSSGNALTLNLANGNIFSHTTTENTTINFTNPASSPNGSGFLFILTQDGTGRSITWPSSVDWDSGSAPTVTTASKVYVLSFFTVDGGTTWYGVLLGSEFA